MRQVWSHVACAVCCACALTGCRFGLVTDLVADQGWTWRRPELHGADRAAEHKPAPMTVPLELVFVRADEHDAGWQDELWNLTDEQAFDHALRRRLAANGLRAGLLTGHLPPALAARLEPIVPSTAPESRSTASADRPAVMRRFLKLLPGRDNEVVATAGLDQLILFEHDGTEVHGETYRDATTYFALKAWPSADGRVRVELVPAVKHGPLERSWVGEEGAFRLETGQKRRPLEQLVLTATIPQGGTLLVGATGDAPSTVGAAFFRDDSAASRARRLLAIRPQARPVDPLFTDTADVISAPPTSAAN